MKPTKSILDLLASVGYEHSSDLVELKVRWLIRGDSSVRLCWQLRRTNVSVYEALNSSSPSFEVETDEWWRTAESLAERLTS